MSLTNEFGPGSVGFISYDHLDCRGTESFIFECISSKPDNMNVLECGHDQDVGVICVSSTSTTGSLVALTTEHYVLGAMTCMSV